MTAAENAAYVLVGFTATDQLRSGFDQLAELADAGTITVLDVEFIHSIHGMASTVTASSLDHRLAGLDSLDAGLLTHADLGIVVGVMLPGSTAAVVIYRGGPIAPSATQWSADGATIVGAGAFSLAAGLAPPS